jgi:hypothetical protein
MNLPNGNVVTPASPVAQNIHEGGGPVRFGTVVYHMDLGSYVVPDTNKDRVYHVAGTARLRPTVSASAPMRKTPRAAIFAASSAMSTPRRARQTSGPSASSATARARIPAT